MGLPSVRPLGTTMNDPDLEVSFEKGDYDRRGTTRPPYWDPLAWQLMSWKDRRTLADFYIKEVREKCKKEKEERLARERGEGGGLQWGPCLHGRPALLTIRLFWGRVVTQCYRCLSGSETTDQGPC